MNLESYSNRFLNKIKKFILSKDYNTNTKSSLCFISSQNKINQMWLPRVNRKGVLRYIIELKIL